MSNTREWTEIRADYEEACGMSCKPVHNKVPDNHIFNENMTVKWNREKVAEHNKSYDDKVKELRERRLDALRNVVDEVVNKIACELHITNSRAEILWDYVYDRSEGCYDLFRKLEEVVDMLHEMFCIKEEN